MSSLEWVAVRADAIERFGEVPSTALEEVVLDIFEQYPVVVIRAIDQIAGKLERGEVQSGWAVLRRQVEGAGNAVREATVELEDERERFVQLAENRLRNVGHMLESKAEVEAELYGGRGLLAPWADDDELRGRMLAVWESRERA